MWGKKVKWCVNHPRACWVCLVFYQFYTSAFRVRCYGRKRALHKLLNRLAALIFGWMLFVQTQKHHPVESLVVEPDESVLSGTWLSGQKACSSLVTMLQKKGFVAWCEEII